MERIALWNAIQVTVTTTATSLKDLITTADWTITVPNDCNYIVLNAEWDVRYSSCWTPTTSIGMKLASWETLIKEWVSPNTIKLIASGSTKVNVELWRVSSLV